MRPLRSLMLASALSPVLALGLAVPVLAQEEAPIEGLQPGDLPPDEAPPVLELEDLPPEEMAPVIEQEDLPPEEMAPVLEPEPAPDPAPDGEAAVDDPFATAGLADPVDDFSAVIKGDRAVLRGLNKVTAQTEDFTANFNEPLQFGSMTVLVRYCSRRPPELIPETFVFLEVYDRTFDGVETTTEEYGQKIFSGWMLGSSPALHGLEHPVYDIWPIGCEAPGDDEIAAEIAAEAEAAAAERAANEEAAGDEVLLD